MHFALQPPDHLSGLYLLHSSLWTSLLYQGSQILFLLVPPVPFGTILFQMFPLAAP